MENRIYDEKNGLWYEKQGDYFIPCLSLPEEEDKPVGIWGQRHLRYIKQRKRVFYTTLLTSCKLNSYLADVNEQADEMFFRLAKQLAEKENITEKLKAENPQSCNGSCKCGNNLYGISEAAVGRNPCRSFMAIT